MIAGHPVRDPSLSTYAMQASDPTSRTAELRHLLVRLVELGEPARQMELLSWEHGDVEGLKRDLVPAVGRQARQAIDLYAELGELLEELCAAAPQDGGLQSALDTVWVARMELSRRAGQLAASERIEGVWPLLSLCESCLRKVRSTAANVEAHLAPICAHRPRLAVPDGLTLSRQIRALYAAFRRQIEEVAGLALEPRLRRAAAAIARLIGSDVYRELRVYDRAEFHNLQARLAEWQRRSDPVEAEGGEHLWQDLYGFTQLLAQVNRRSELVEHDRKVIGGLLSEMRGHGEAEEPPSSSQRVRLETLDGRDPQLDAFLRDGAIPRRAWVVCLERLRSELNGSGGAA